VRFPSPRSVSRHVLTDPQILCPTAKQTSESIETSFHDIFEFCSSFSCREDGSSGRCSSIYQVAVHLFIRPPSDCSSGRRATVHQAAGQLFIRPPCYWSSGWRATVFQTRVLLLIQSGAPLLFRPACYCLSGRLLTLGTANGSLNLSLAYIWRNRNSCIRKNTNVPRAALRGEAWGRVRELHARRGAWRTMRSGE
jgi:hypothetical protein